MKASLYILLFLLFLATQAEAAVAVEAESTLWDVKTPTLRQGAVGARTKTKAKAKAKGKGKTTPHLFVVLVDDLGWSNVGFRATGKVGSCEPEEAVTPTIDKLVKQGILLNRHYTYNYCSPSRASLQSGRLPVHVSELNDDPTSWNPDDPVSGYAGIPRNMTGLAAKLKLAGYKTHMTGKWDAGMATHEHTPMGRGYDTFVGYYHHANDYYTERIGANSVGILQDVCQKNSFELVDLWNTKHPAYGMNGTDYEEALFTRNTLKVIEAHDARDPLFLFHAFHIVHTPLQVPKEHEDRFSSIKPRGRRLYAAMVNYMDEALGKFVNALEEKGMWSNTLMLLSSDNGGPIYGVTGALGSAEGAANNMPLRGGKLSDFEGGIRVNAFLSGGYIPPSVRGSMKDGYIHIADWYSTLCSVAGIDAHDAAAEKAGLPPIDSINMLPFLFDEVKESPRKDIHISEFTIISGKYKLITGSGLPVSTKWARSLTRHIVLYDGYWAGYGLEASINTLTKFRNCRRGCLYNIIDDPYETKDLSKSMPSLLDKMMNQLKEKNQSLFRPKRGNQDIKACTRWNGYYGPWLQ